MRSEWLRRRLFWTAVLVLISLGGAGLASAVDRPQTQRDRPELGFTTDARAEPWMDEMLEELGLLESQVVALAAAGRRVFIGASILEPGEIDAGVAVGDAISRSIAEDVVPLVELRGQIPEGMATWRLGEVRREQLARIDAAVDATTGLATIWPRLAAAGTLAAELMTAVARHDELVLAALAAGRNAAWEEAVGLLVDAGPALDEAAAVHDRLDAQARSQLFDDLLARHRAHDAALLALYRHIAQSGSFEDAQAIELRRQVDAVRVEVPTPPGTMRAVVAESAGASLTEYLAAIEEARGSIGDARDEGEDDPFSEEEEE